MNTRRLTLTRMGALIGGLAIAVSVLGACQSAPKDEQKDSAPTTTIDPMGPNSYAPQVKAPGPQTALPGNVKTG